MVMLTKRVIAKGKAVAHQSTCPQAHKVTCIISPPLDALEAPGPKPPVTGPSVWPCSPLFEEPALYGGEEVGPGGPASSGE